MQYEIKNLQYLLNEGGNVINSGWCKSPYFVYDKAFCGVSMFSLNERDCYYISNKEIGIYISVAQYGINTNISATLINFETGEIKTKTITKFFSIGQVNLPMSSETGDVTFADNRLGINFANTSIKRYIKCDFVNFCEDKNLYINLVLTEKHKETLNIAIPYKNNTKKFFLKHFRPSMSVTGVVRYGRYEYNMTNEYSTAYLDWSRYSCVGSPFYYAIYADSIVTGKQFALCLSFGNSGDTSRGNENCFFYDGRVHKLSTIKATGTETHLNRPWRFFSTINPFEIVFHPKKFKTKLLSVNCDKRTIVFGEINGEILLDNEQIYLKNISAHMEFTIL